MGRMFSKKAVISTALFIVIISPFLLFMFRIPGKSYHGNVPPLTDEQIVLREQLRKDVTELAGKIGDRNVSTEYENLCKASDFIEKSFVDAGCKVSLQCYEVSQCGLEGHPKIAAYRNNLGVAWSAKGEYDKAIEYLEKALSVIQVRFGDNHPYTKTLKGNLSLAKEENPE